MIAFVILHYQAINETIDCVRTIKEKVTSDKKIIVVDNCSPNKSGRELEKLYSSDEEVNVLLLESNLGFAKGNNIGYRAAKKYNPNYVVVMNNDAFIDCDNLEALINNVFDETKFDILGPDIYSTRDKIHQNPHRLTNFTLPELKKQCNFLRLKNSFKFLLRIKYAILRKQKSEPKKKEYINVRKENVVLHGACYIYSAPYIKKHDCCLYDDTFMYYESYILQALAIREGLKMVYDPAIRIKHHEDIATNLSHGKGYEKAVFTNRWLLDSCEKFISILTNPDVRIG